MRVNWDAIKVYDPKIDGFDAEALFGDFGVGRRAARNVLGELYEKVKASKIGDKNLSSFLFDSREGYFIHNPHVGSVVFVDGKFYSEYIGDEQEDIITLAKAFNSIPFNFSYHRINFDRSKLEEFGVLLDPFSDIVIQ